MKFGTWPLMEVTRTGSLFKASNRVRGLRGGRNNGPPKGPGGFGPGPGGYRLGPPPTPSKLLLMSQTQKNKGAIHKHLQDTLKQYAAGGAKPLNLNLPIIVKAPGPNPPPPPPGYKLGPPSGALTSDGWLPGPPYQLNDVTGPGALSGAQPKGRLQSMLMNAAYSGIFKNAVDAYTAPEFNPGPPFSGTYIQVQPDGTQVRTHVNGDVIPGTRTVPAEGVETKPSLPPTLKIGDPLPENYTILYAERQIIGVKTPDTLERSGNVNPGTDEYDAEFSLGGKYEQGHGRKPHYPHALLVQKFQKRGDLHHLKPDKLVTQELPDEGLMSSVNMVISTPNISAPLGGKSSPHFKAALEDKQRMLKNRKKEKPLDAQVKLLGRLFTKLQRLKPPMIRVPADENEPEGEGYAGGNNEPGGWNKPDDDGWNKVAKTKVDSPIMAVQIQTISVPEVDSSDPDIVESMAEFGNHDIEFGETDEIVGLMETLMNHGSSRIDISELGSNPQEINDNLLSWVRKHLAMTREANKEALQRGEEIAKKQFKQYQTFVTPPFGQNGWGPGEPMPVDPKVASRSLPIALTNSMASYKRQENP